MEEITAAVLRNRGAPIRLYELDGEGRRVEREGDFAVETHWVRFDANAIAEFEERYAQTRMLELPDPETGTVTKVEVAVDVGEAIADAIQRKTTRELRWCFAVALGKPEEWVGARMIDGAASEYTTAWSVAWALANGVDPDVAKKVLEAGVDVTSAVRVLKTQAVADMLEGSEETGESPGENGTRPGAVSASPPPISGG